MFNRKSNWSYNKREKDAIVYVHSGAVTRVTLEMFINNGCTEEEFRRVKNESDAMFHREDNLDVTEKRRSEALDEAIESGKYAVKSPEDLIIEYIDCQVRQTRLKDLKPLAKKALDKLTSVQRRRYLLHVCEGLTTRHIAEIENVRHQSVVESLQAADKKIRKAIGNR